MKKYFCMLPFIAMCLLASCGDTTNTETGSKDIAADSAVGNSEAANTIYRDSADISHATEPGGGTGNPSNQAPTAGEGSDEDSIRR